MSSRGTPLTTPKPTPRLSRPEAARTATPMTNPKSVAPRASSSRGNNQVMYYRWVSGRKSTALLGQAVAGAADRFDHAGALHALQRLAQPLDVDVDGALLDEDVVAPDAVQQLRA